MSQSDDLDAINAYMMRTQTVNPVATALKNDWIAWWNGLGYYDKNIASGTFDIARNKRNAFNIANVSSLEEEQQVQDVIKNGISAEQAQGLPDRRDSNGMYPIPPPSMAKEWFYLAAATVFLGVLGYSISSVARITGR